MIQALPIGLAQRLHYWRNLWSASAKHLQFFGVVLVAPLVISTSLEGPGAKVLLIIAAIASALIGLMHPECRYFKFVRALRLLDLAARRSQQGLIDALREGETLIFEFEDKLDGLVPDERPASPTSQAPDPATSGRI